MKVVIINKSDATGGAAVVTRRLMDALRRQGVDARMLVAEKLTDSPYIEEIGTPLKRKAAFYADRLPIAFANGFSRKSLFKIDAAAFGLNVENHPWVKEADVLLLNWINQGVLSLRGIQKLTRLGKGILWTMHDMWCMTGICHHAGVCTHYEKPNYCGSCPMLAGNDVGSGAVKSAENGKFRKDLSHRVAERKEKIYAPGVIRFVAVSHWLERKALGSTLLGNQKIYVVPNAFKLGNYEENISVRKKGGEGKLRLIFGAARLDDDIKGFPTLIRSLEMLKEMEPESAARVRVTLFGGIKDGSLIEKIPVECDYRGVVRDENEVKVLYQNADIVLSTSHFETLPGTLVEGQAYGCVPVSFNRGGQRDIIDHGDTGYLVEWSDDLDERARRFAEGIVWVSEYLERDEGVRKKVYESVKSKFSEETVALKYMEIFKEMKNFS